MGGGDSQGPPSAAKGMAACEDPDATAPGELVGEVDPTGTVTEVLLSFIIDLVLNRLCLQN